MTAFQRTTTGPLDEIDEELALLDGSAGVQISDELRAFDDWWRARPRGLPPTRESPFPVPRPHTGRPNALRGIGWGAAALACAAAAAAAAFMHFAAPFQTEHRTMGGLPVDVVASRGAMSVGFTELQEGDLLFVTMTAPRDGCMSVGTVSGAGGAQPLTRVPVTRGQQATPGAALRLDGAMNPEWLVVQLDDCDAPATIDASPRADRFVLDVTRAAAR